MSDWKTQIINEFRANEGRVGGNFEGAPLLLLHTRAPAPARSASTP